MLVVSITYYRNLRIFKLFPAWRTNVSLAYHHNVESLPFNFGYFEQIKEKLKTRPWSTKGTIVTIKYAFKWNGEGYKLKKNQAKIPDMI